MTNHYRTIIVGAGIVGVSAAWELAKLGRTDILVIDRAPLFETGGSTSHAPGGIFQNNASRTVSKLAQWTTGAFTEVSPPDAPTWGVRVRASTGDGGSTSRTATPASRRRSRTSRRTSPSIGATARGSRR